MEREQTTIRLPSDLKEEVQEQAESMGISFNELVMTAINDLINQQK